jgi:ankyrin repeat protein
MATARTLFLFLFLVLAISCPLSAKAQRADGSPGQRLWQSAFDGDLEGVKTAVRQGAGVNVKGKGGFSALLAACRNGHLPVVVYLVEHGADVNQRDNMRDKTPLTAAAFQSHAEIVAYLLAHDAEIDDQSVNGWTALHDAAYIGCFECVKSLVEHNADLHIKNERHETALESAERGSREAVRRGQSHSSPDDYRRIREYLKSHGA